MPESQPHIQNKVRKKMPKNPPNKRTDWTRVERLYRAGLLSIYEIARECHTAEANVRYHAKSKGWKRDLTDAMRSSARIKMVENLASFDSVDADKLKQSTDDDLIEQAARTQVQVVREHQKTLGQGHSLTLRMLDELDTTTAYKGELQELISTTVAPSRQEALRRAVSLGSRATIMRDLATAARLWVTLERQAFSIADDRDRDNKEQRKLDEMTAEQLRAEIIDDAKKMGLDLDPKELSRRTVGIAAKTNGTSKVH